MPDLHCYVYVCFLENSFPEHWHDISEFYKTDFNIRMLKWSIIKNIPYIYFGWKLTILKVVWDYVQLLKKMLNKAVMVIQNFSKLGFLFITDRSGWIWLAVSLSQCHHNSPGSPHSPQSLCSPSMLSMASSSSVRSDNMDPMSCNTSPADLEQPESIITGNSVFQLCFLNSFKQL